MQGGDGHPAGLARQCRSDRSQDLLASHEVGRDADWDVRSSEGPRRRIGAGGRSVRDQEHGPCRFEAAIVPEEGADERLCVRRLDGAASVVLHGTAHDADLSRERVDGLGSYAAGTSRARPAVHVMSDECPDAGLRGAFSWQLHAHELRVDRVGSTSSGRPIH